MGNREVAQATLEDVQATLEDIQALCMECKVHMAMAQDFAHHWERSNASRKGGNSHQHPPNPTMHWPGCVGAAIHCMMPAQHDL